MTKLVKTTLSFLQCSQLAGIHAIVRYFIIPNIKQLHHNRRLEYVRAHFHVFKSEQLNDYV